jgi:ankyrin repeat protein
MKCMRSISSIVALALICVSVPGCSGTTNADVEAVDPATLAPQDAVYEVAASGDVSSMGLLIEAYPMLVNAPNLEGRTPLHFAAGNNQRRMVDYLLQNGANPWAEDVNQETPADAARQEGYLDMANYLSQVAATAR